MIRFLRVVVHNWPLKLAAIGLATVLYGGLVLSQDAETFRSELPIRVDNLPETMYLVEPPPPVTEIRYLAPAGTARPGPGTFRASIDLADVSERGGTVVRRVTVTSADPSIQILGVTPQSVEVRLDPITVKIVPVVIEYGQPPDNVEVGASRSEPRTVTVTGPESTVRQIVAARASVVVQPSGINVDQDVSLVPVDAVGNAVSLAAVDPSTARVMIAVLTEPETQTIPINPVITGTPAAGFEIDSVRVDPPAALVEGDADALAAVAGLDTEPLTISGLADPVTFEAELALPEGVARVTDTPITVSVTFRPVNESRTFTTGILLVGRAGGLDYTIATDRLLLVVGGSPPALDTLAAAGGPVATLDVTGLGPGTYDLAVSAELAAGLNLVTASPSTVSVTIAAPVDQSPAPTAAATGS